MEKESVGISIIRLEERLIALSDNTEKLLSQIRMLSANS